MTEIEKVKSEIKVLEKKLSFLEELERTKTPCEEAYKKVYGLYPETGNWTSDDDIWIRWLGFKAGYKSAQEDYKVGEYQETAQERGERLHKDVERVVKESVKWCEEHPDKDPLDCLKPQTEKEVKKLQEKDWEIKVETDYLTGKARHKTKIVDKDGNDYKPEPLTTEELLKPNWEPTPQNEKQVEEGLRSAMRQAKKEGVFDTTKESWMDKPIDELVDKLMENPPECLKFQLGKTLEQIVNRWWRETFTTHEKWSVDECIDDLIDQIELWFPREQSAEGSQDLYACIAVDAENDLLKKIKSKLRNKKDT